MTANVINPGGDKATVTLDDKNNDPELYVAAVGVRYNIMFSQMVSATVPCNTDLNAGSSIKILLKILQKIKNKDQIRLEVVNT